MEVSPPIKERSTNELISIIENPERWRNDVVNLAEKTLSERGITIEEQQKKRNRHKQRRKSYKQRTKKIKNNASYSLTEKILIILFGPLLILLTEDFLIFSQEVEFKKKNRQSWICLILGCLFWFTLILLFFSTVNK
ncbi:hypothetical protein MY04_5443 [Flammeovirga sp. MY04]|uniref:hypothetical protein n=1 Tax=Flammeovirga sp. MY04 TaxID=1191459 RepID=UPI0008063920|nr:hypothetical protein [Flammeovirga sp. MY04]ANQ52774.1 hypothetical protein MY04_5443 [Flammeovirga sp. MY04]